MEGARKGLLGKYYPQTQTAWCSGNYFSVLTSLFPSVKWNCSSPDLFGCKCPYRPMTLQANLEAR